MKLEKMTITIDFGNAAMQTIEDAADALREVCKRIDRGQEPTKIMDGNGNAVGSVEYESAAKPFARVGDKLRVVVPIDIAEDLEWPCGTVVEVVQVDRDSFEAAGPGCDAASFARIDLDSEHRWFDRVE